MLNRRCLLRQPVNRPRSALTSRGSTKATVAALTPGPEGLPLQVRKGTRPQACSQFRPSPTRLVQTNKRYSGLGGNLPPRSIPGPPCSGRLPQPPSSATNPYRRPAIPAPSANLERSCAVRENDIFRFGQPSNGGHLQFGAAAGQCSSYPLGRSTSSPRT
jgi:hypothetical protein